MTFASKILTTIGILGMLFSAYATYESISLRTLDNQAYIIFLFISSLLLTFINGVVLRHFAAYRIQQNGVATIGMLVDFKEKNITVNGRPEREFTVRFQTTEQKVFVRKVRSFFQFPFLMKEMPIPICYDPQNPEKIAINNSYTKTDLQKLFAQFNINNSQ